ncbi:MAG: hypothetical protein PHD82_17075 [Candidatus Riflebacteria bacterium]|nr:hypothetical protein [Candidatus Riflebacteria bacterium]
MRSGLKSIVTIVSAVFMLTSVSLSAQNDWIDATHLFDDEVRGVVSSLKRETRENTIVRNRAMAPIERSIQIGDTHTFWTKNIVENRFEETRAVLKAVGKNCYVFLEAGKTLTAEAIEKVRKNFDEIIYPANTRNFGSEWKPGIDGDDKITLLLFDVKDGYNGSGGFVGGYFYAVDCYLQEKIPEHLKSNEREMIYLDINPSDPASDRFANTVAHEFQHMIHFNQDSSEYTWVNEACSQIAPYLCGFGHANQVVSFMRTPDNSLTAWAKEQMLANYGQVYLWNYYILHRFLREDDAARTTFFKNLVASKKQGVAGYVEALSSISKSFTSTFDKFCLANYLNDERAGKGEFGYDKSLARLKLPVSETVSVLPAEISGEVFLWSADAVKIELKNARSDIKLSFKGFRGKMGEDQYNSFTVALALLDSTGKIPPRISYFDIAPLSSKLQGGNLTITPPDSFDSAMLIIVAQADEEVDDRVYAKAQPMKYSVKISDAGSAVVRASSSVEIQELVADYALTSERLGEAGEAEAMIALDRLENTRRILAEELLTQLENNENNVFAVIDEMLASGQVALNAIEPLLKDLNDTARFRSVNR